MIINMKFRVNEENRVVAQPADSSKEMTFSEGVSLEMIQQGYGFYYKGKIVQDAFPFLNADEREFLMTGLTPEEWEDLWGDEDEADINEESL